VRIDLDAANNEQFKARPTEVKIASLQWTINEWTKAEAYAKKLINRL
jgi:hypothetical protein